MSNQAFINATSDGHESMPSLPNNREEAAFGTYGFGSQGTISPVSGNDVAPDAAKAFAYDEDDDLNTFTEIHQAYAAADLTTHHGHEFGNEHASSLHDVDENIWSTDDQFGSPSYPTTSPFPSRHHAHASAPFVPEMAMHQQLGIHHERQVPTVDHDAADSSIVAPDVAWGGYLDLDSGEAEACAAAAARMAAEDLYSSD